MAIVAPNFGFTLETRLVLIFEMGQLQTNQDTDHQTACAFCVRHPLDCSQVFAAPQTHRREFRMKTVGLG